MAKKKFKKIIFETYNEPGYYCLRDLQQPEPSCFNSEINVEKYKVTIEKVEQSDQEIIDTLMSLYIGTDNYHQKSAIDKYSTKRYGLRIFDLVNN